MERKGKSLWDLCHKDPQNAAGGGGETYSTQLQAELDHSSQQSSQDCSVITPCLPLDPAPCLTHIPTQPSPPQHQLHCTEK